jgi:putative membrane protein
MLNRLLSPVILVLLVACSPQNNRRDGDTGMAEGAPGGIGSRDTMPAATADSAATAGTGEATPAAVLSQMNLANTTEIQLSTVASRQATSPRVKQIARKLIADHTRNREQVLALAQRVNLTLTPARGASVSAADSAAMPADLQGKTGADFDRAFIEHEIRDHQSNIQKIQNQLLPASQDQQLKDYLQKTVTEMQGHLGSLQEVQQQLGS